ncbi:sensor histidine kinase [Dokdonia sp. Hel_I_53]|uniref:sensor histidine kinase n=1 Tax=Dokdonia sp. Hel_I_53 TaxID=1566287 RepID=UPI00119B9159|nr:sensor histidine kinase [Dokdonia sp. Hel_I_53]TVZ52407.1 phospho-acceptor domain-containing protein [Dokdonia sp. Hel_I_53]
MDTKDSKNIVRSLYLSFFSTLAVIILIVALYFASQYSQKWIIHTNGVKADIHSLSETLTRAESKLRGYLISKDPEYRIDFKVEIAKLDNKLDVIQSKIYDNPSQLDNLRKYRALINERVSGMNNSMDNFVLGTPDENRRRAGRTQILSLIDSLDNIKDVMLVEENELLIDRKSTYDTIFVFSLVALAIALLLMLYNVYAVRQRLLPLFTRLAENNDELTSILKSRDNEIELKEAQIEVNEDLLHQMENKNKQLNQFAYIASHDLQEPLRTVDNFIALFEEEYGEKLDSDASQYFNFIKGATERMKGLITGLLNYSRLGKSGRRVKVELSKLLEEIKSDMISNIQDTGAVITNDSLPKISGYPVELRQLFANLIGNAIKFMPKEKTPKIHIGVSESLNYYTFKISDNGLGIKKAHLDKIFNMFTRLHTAKEYQGTGIGLAFCQKIVELHKGTITVDSKLGEGSTFTFTLKK